MALNVMRNLMIARYFYGSGTTRPARTGDFPENAGLVARFSAHHYAVEAKQYTAG